MSSEEGEKEKKRRGRDSRRGGKVEQEKREMGRERERDKIAVVFWLD